MIIRKFEVRAEDYPDHPNPELVAKVNDYPDRFFRLKSALAAVEFYENIIGLPCHFFVINQKTGERY